MLHSKVVIRRRRHALVSMPQAFICTRSCYRLYALRRRAASLGRRIPTRFFVQTHTRFAGNWSGVPSAERDRACAPAATGAAGRGSDTMQASR